MTDLDTGAELHAYIDAALSDLDVPTARLRDGAIQQGRVARRRRHVGAALGGLAVAVAIAAIALPTLTGSDTTDGGVAHDTTPPQNTYEPPAGWWDMPGATMRERLAPLLPAGMTITDANLGNEELAPGDQPHGGWLQVDVADDSGAAAGGVNVLLYAPQPKTAEGRAFVEERISCPGNLSGPDRCTELRDGTGNVVGRTSRWAAGGVVVVEATRLTPEGAVVYAAASNSSDDKWGRDSSTDADAPPVNLAQLRDIAGDPTWRDWTPPRG